MLTLAGLIPGGGAGIKKFLGIMAQGLSSPRVACLVNRVGAVLLVTALLFLDCVVTSGCSWARVRAETGAGQTATTQPSQLTLDVQESLGLARSQWPITAGVPFPQGLVTDPARLVVTDDSGRATPVQARVLSRWQDGSVRWALLDWQTDLEARQTRRFRVAPGAPVATTRTVKVRERDDRIDVDTGPLQFSVPKNRFAWLQQARLNGVDMLSGPVVSFFNNIDGGRVDGQIPSAVTVTEAGPLRVRLEIHGHYGARFDYVIRIDAFANQPFLRVLHSFEQHSPEAYTMVRQIGVTVPLTLRNLPWYRAGQEDAPQLSGKLAAGGFSLLQEDNDRLVVAGARRAGHAAGWIDAGDEKHGVAIAARSFWQQYPQSFQAQTSGITYNLWAPEAPPAKVGMGVAKTHEVLLYFHDSKPPPQVTLTALVEPVLAWVDPNWTVASGALRNSIAPSPTTKGFLQDIDAAYRRYLNRADKELWDDSGEVRCPDPMHERPRHGFYGMLNWGDWNYPGYHDTTKGCDAWGNLEYDMTQVLALAYAATGTRAYYEGMVAAARHFMDVDRIHYQHEHPNWIGMNHPKAPLHFAFELGGVDLGHTWVEGLLSYYYLTGDERALEAARGIADYLVNRLHAGIGRGNPRQWGWPQIALVAAFEATGDVKYRSGAQDYARKGMAAHASGKTKDWKLGILAEGLAYTHSLTHDGAIRDWLSRYAAANSRRTAIDPRFLPAVAYVARIQNRSEYARSASAGLAGLKFGNWGKPFTIAGRIGFSLLSLAPQAAAAPAAP
ncbi:MAG: hypothetical protein ABSA52_03750 [Candidatus Binatia bacterium]